MNGMRKSLGLMVGTALMCMFAFLFFQAGAPEVQAAEAVVTRLGWLGGCYPPASAVGRYFPGDAPCRPSETISLAAIQSALSAHGVMIPGETLRFSPDMRARALTCWGFVEFRGQGNGWICSDEAGLYRVDMGGQPVSAHWQLLSDGTWSQASQ